MSQRALALKYGVARSTLRHRAERENWMQTIINKDAQAAQQAQQCPSNSEDDKTSTALKRVAQRPKPDFTFEDRKACQDVVHTLIWKLLQAVDLVPVEDVRTMRDISMVLRDLKDLGVYRYDLDVKEQEARIAKLEKEASIEEKDNIVSVVIEPDLEEFSG